MIGGGTVGTRKASALHDAGARVRIMSLAFSDELSTLGSVSDRVTLERRAYGGETDIGDADLVIAATDSVETNSRIAADARRLHRLVSAVNAPSEGTFASMAVHRSENVTIGVSAGRAPKEAVRMRDAIAERFQELREGKA